MTGHRHAAAPTRVRVAGVAAACAVLLAAGGCDNSNLTSINNDPNHPTVAPAGPVFTNATRTAVGRWLGTGFDLRGTEWVAQHLAEVQYPDEDRYARLQGSNTTGFFDAAYANELEDFKKVVSVGRSDQDAGVYAPALVMQTWTFSNLTDVWGDIPYSQALQGDTAGGTLTPAYDAQKDIYTSFFATLHQAAVDLDAASGPGLGSADPIYGGDNAEWQKFANSLHARLALRLVNVDPTTAQAELAAAFSDPGGVIETNADNAELRWPGDGVFNNPWSDNFKSRDDHRMSRTLMDILVATNDPRTGVYAQPVADSSLYPGGYGGMPNGLLNDSAGKYIKIASKLGAGFYAENGGARQPSFLLTAAEVLFIEAEAKERGLVPSLPGTAKEYYESAVRASMEQWGITDAPTVDAYLAEPSVSYDAAATQADRLKRIAVQKWIALFTDGTQAWAEWRRTCQPSTVKAGPAAIIDFVPRRFEYSQTEYAVNAENLNAAVSRQGPDNFGSRMYWDTNPTAAPTYVDAPTCGP
ncbi:MAG: SusD/RagB family nutrient-binding outer membrane lipoprotein [Gemmatimonadaceae bacterium]|nr:SusD/RagB family nutrient-binding outer membrane lipoprotein [Gemmatimonadaceae bacterium]